MKIKCPRCKSQLEVDAIGDFVACFHCSLEFTVDEPTVDEATDDASVVDEPPVDEPKKRKSIWFFLTNFRWSKIKWFKLFVGGFSILVVTFFVLISIASWWFFRNEGFTLPESPVDGVSYKNVLLNILGGTGFAIFNLAVVAVLLLIFINIILWIFLPLMVYSIKKSLEEAVREIKNLNNL